MASQDVWADFEVRFFRSLSITRAVVLKACADRQQTLRHNLRYYKVDHLKQIVVGFNEECSSNLTKSGKKQDLIDRIHNELQDWKKRGLVDRWMKGKAIAYRVRQTGT